MKILETVRFSSEYSSIINDFRDFHILIVLKYSGENIKNYESILTSLSNKVQEGIEKC